MFGFGKKNKTSFTDYDPKTMKAVLRCSICTGEQVAGFRENSSGKFIDVMLIRDDKDLEVFKEKYGIESISKEY